MLDGVTKVGETSNFSNVINVHTTPSCMILDYPIFSLQCPLICQALDPMDCQQLHKTLCKLDCPQSYKALYPLNFSQPCKTLYPLDCQQLYKMKQ